MSIDLQLNNAAAYSEMRRNDLLQEVKERRTTQPGAESPPVDVLPLAVRVGDLLIAAGTKLKERYTLPNTDLPVQISHIT